jgi:hypothetical protein
MDSDSASVNVTVTQGLLENSLAAVGGNTIVYCVPRKSLTEDDYRTTQLLEQPRRRKTLS